MRPLQIYTYGVPCYNAPVKKKAESVIEIKRNGVIERITIDPSQAWYWSEEWQSRAREAEEDIAQGRFKEFATIDDLIADLHKPYLPK